MYNHNKKLTPYAKKLRKNMTLEERNLWYKFLRGYKIRFLRQKVIKNYIVDFYCSKASLVIELMADNIMKMMLYCKIKCGIKN